MNVFGFAVLILIFPVIGVLFNGFVGRRFVDQDRVVGEAWSGWFATVMALSAFGVAVALALTLANHGYEAGIVTMFDWFNIPSAHFHIPWAIQVDTLSVTMMLVVTGVGSLIHIYAIGYMHGDPNFSRFFTYLNLFLFFMLILVTGSSYLVLFVGWEGVGLCSFLLIGFWFDRVNDKGEAMNANAARKAFVANRVGDLAMILAMTLTFWVFGSLEFNSVFSSATELFKSHEMVTIFNHEFTVGAVLTAVTALFLLGATGKSAQIPLYVWLPDAMAGPTPVSALIHAATMVTSGIYLIVRSNVLFEIVRASHETLPWIHISSPDLVAYVGAATALFAGLVAFTQFDIKKVLAYSTVSQLGFMIAAVGMGAYVAGMFHLITHAFFKALLFMGSGSVIHGMEHGHHHATHGDHHGHAAHFDPQDMRTMGGLKDKMPWTFWTYLIGSFALAGLPIFAGFWSKDEILAHAKANGQTGVYILLTLAAMCTAFYMGRQLKMTFFGKPRHEAAKHAPESTWTMILPLVVLAFLAITGGMWINLPYLSSSTAAANHDHPAGSYLRLESWLEHSIASFELSTVEGNMVEATTGDEHATTDEHATAPTAEGEGSLLHLPHTPVVLSPAVAGISTILALLSMAGSFFIVYGKKPQNATEKDPLESIPFVWRFFSSLPFNTLYMGYLIPTFNRLTLFLGITVDWEWWHNFFHERLIRDAFVGWTRFTYEIVERQGVDGLLVNGAGRLTSKLANVIRKTQTGYVQNYALSVFFGVVALLATFLYLAR